MFILYWNIHECTRRDLTAELCDLSLKMDIFISLSFENIYYKQCKTKYETELPPRTLNTSLISDKTK